VTDRKVGISSEDSLLVNVEPLILASTSPRRLDLLRSVGITCEVVPSGVVESLLSLPPVEQARHWAHEKASEVARRHPDRWVLAADTSVVLGRNIFGKPRNAADAFQMLAQLSGRVHEVISGLCLVQRRRQVCQLAAVRTRVQFKQLSDAEIHAYVATGEPFDKAGAYGIQGQGAVLVRSVHGSYTNVVGLPLTETVEWLLRYGVVRARNADAPGSVAAAKGGSGRNRYADC